MGSTEKQDSRTQIATGRFAAGEMRKTLIAFLSGAIGIVCATGPTYGHLRDGDVMPIKSVKVTRPLR